MDVQTRTEGHVDECKYHFIAVFLMLVYFNVSLYFRVESWNIPVYHTVGN